MLYRFPRKFKLYVILLLIVLGNISCGNKLKVNPNQLFQSYNDEQIALIEANWKQYFKEDIFSALDSNLSVLPIAFDSYGGIYPNDTIFQQFIDDNFAAGIPGKKAKFKNIVTMQHSDNDLNKYSMFQIFQWAENAEKLEAGIGAIKNAEDKKFYGSLLFQYSTAPGYNGRKINKSSVDFYRDIDGFYKQWNAYHLNRTNKALLKKINTEKPDRILFFIHGYNVPYSLAVLQSIKINEYVESIQDQINEPRKLLLVPIFWSSNDQKKSELNTEEKVKIRDEVKVSNALKWGFYSTRANFAGIGLRQVIHQLELSTSELPELLIFSHSLGTVVATNTLVNAINRLDGKYTTQVTSDTCGEVNIAEQVAYKLEEKDNINYKLYQKFNDIPLPKSKIRVFLSAPAISGIETFQDMCEEQKVSSAFFSTVNSKDLTLKKFVGIVNGLGCTSLGLNNACDAMQTKIDYFWDHGYFYYNKEPIEITQHNIFDYMQQPAYRALVKDFLTFQFPAANN